VFEAETLTLAQSVLDACRARGWHVATAESCTGGLVAGALTAIAGSSDVLERGFVTYSNEAKSELLGVPPPPEIPFEEARRNMTPMALSFYEECRRADNIKLKTALGVRLRYPTYREGLRASFENGDY